VPVDDETELLNEEDCVAKTVVNVDIVDVDDNEIDEVEDGEDEDEDATVEDGANSSSVATEASLFAISAS